MSRVELRRIRLAGVDDLPTNGRSLLAAATRAGFEVMVTKVVETELVTVHGVHPERGRFECAWTAGRTTSGFYAPRRPEWRMVPDLRTTDPLQRDDEGNPLLDRNKKPKRNPNRKPNGIGVERPEMVGGYVGVNAVLAWIKSS